MVEYVIPEEQKKKIINGILNMTIQELSLKVMVTEFCHGIKTCKGKHIKINEKQILLTKIQDPRGLKNGFEQEFNRVRFTASADGGDLAEYTIGRVFRRNAKKPLTSGQKKELEERKRQALSLERWNIAHPFQCGLPE